jgi:hypothetical protein
MSTLSNVEHEWWDQGWNANRYSHQPILHPTDETRQ